MFHASVDTLLRQEGTFFNRLFTGRWPMKPDGTDNAFFIDRDGDLFPFILNFLRDGDAAVLPIEPNKRVQLQQEAECFGVDNLKTKLTENMHSHLQIPGISSLQLATPSRDRSLKRLIEIRSLLAIFISNVCHAGQCTRLRFCWGKMLFLSCLEGIRPLLTVQTVNDFRSFGKTATTQ